MQPAAYRSGWQVEDLANCFVAKTFHFAQRENGSVLIMQGRHGPMELISPFFPQQAVFWQFPEIDRFGTGNLSLLINGSFWFLFSFAADRKVEGNSIQPCVKGAVAPERIQLHEGLDKGLLQDIFRFFATARDLQERIEEAPLVLKDQGSKGLGIAGQRVAD
jgi:hypothetical protein